ncbi:MAG TPA: glycosyltransferase family 87 protein, partial [Anaerolineales bacterium]|nr:glycosyltransferase family 87 protein [Anaerolineales bacterium]
MSRSAARQDAEIPRPAARPSSLRSVLIFWAGAVGIALVLLKYYSLVWRSYVRFNQLIDVCRLTFCDFATYYYPMGEAIFRTGQPVEGFVYSPFVAILFATFSPLRLSLAIIVWGMLQATFVILYIVLFRRLIGGSVLIQWLFVLLLLSSFPLLHTIKWGQVSLFSTVALLGALLFIERRQLPAGAGLLAFAVSFKFVPLLFVAPFAARRDRRALLWIVGALAVALVGVPVVFLGVGRTLDFYRALWVVYGGYGWAATSYNSQYFPHVLLRLAEISGANRLVFWLGQTVGIQAAAWLSILRGVAWIVVLGNLALVYLIQRAAGRRADLWSFAVLFLTIPFLLGTSWPVDLVYLPFVQALLASALFDARSGTLSGLASGRPEWSPSRGRKAALGLMLVASIVCSNVGLFNSFHNYLDYGSLGFVFWSD